MKWKLNQVHQFAAVFARTTNAARLDGPASAEPVAAAIEISEGFENLRLWEQQEPKWIETIDRIVHHRGRSSPDAINAMDLPTQRLVNDWNKLCVTEGVLCRRNKKICPRAVVSESKKLTILQLYHEISRSLHDDVSKMLGCLGQKYYWYNLHSDAQLYVFDCDVCQKKRSNSQHVKEFQSIPVAFPNQRSHINFRGDCKRPQVYIGYGRRFLRIYCGNTNKRYLFSGDFGRVNLKLGCCVWLTGLDTC